MSEPYNPPTAPPPGGPPAYATATPGLPWDRARTGSALIETAKGLITAPARAYAEMREKGDYVSPILFALILGTLGVIVGQIWQLLFGASMLQLLPPDMQGPFAESMAPNVVGVVISIALAPLVIPIVLFILSGIFHLFLTLVGGTKDSTAGFEGTVRAVAYASVSNLAQVIPIAGGVIGGFWAIVLYIIGLAQVHHTTTGKAALAVLLPILFCCVCVAVVFATMGAAIWAAIGANQ